MFSTTSIESIMTIDDSLISNLHTKIKDFEVSNLNIDKKVFIFYLALLGLVMILLVVFMENFWFSAPLIIAFLSLPFVILSKVDPLFVFYSGKQKLAKKKQELLIYISEKEVQLALFNYNFELVDHSPVLEMKKFLALQDFDNAYECISKLLAITIHKQQVTAEARESESFIQEYEMSLRAGN